jgi:hypothetical protein
MSKGELTKKRIIAEAAPVFNRNAQASKRRNLPALQE